MTEDTTYDVRVYRTEVYKGAKVTTYRVRWKTGSPAVEGRVPQRGACRQLPQLLADRGPKGRGIQPQNWPPAFVGGMSRP